MGQPGKSRTESHFRLKDLAAFSFGAGERARRLGLRCGHVRRPLHREQLGWVTDLEHLVCIFLTAYYNIIEHITSSEHFRTKPNGGCWKNTWWEKEKWRSCRYIATGSVRKRAVVPHEMHTIGRFITPTIDLTVVSFDFSQQRSNNMWS